MNIEEARANLKVGDMVRVDGYSICVAAGSGWKIGDHCEWTPAAMPIRVDVIPDVEHFEHHEYGGHRFHHSSIIEVISAEHKPKVGEWRHGADCQSSLRGQPISGASEKWLCGTPEVYRSTGWSRDERKGDRRKK